MDRRWPVLLLALLAFSLSRTGSTQTPEVQWSGADRIIAFGDVHGAFDELRTLLRETGVIDAQDHWAAARTHVVSLGDLIDRGADSRKVIDLLMRLQTEAQVAGGQLHVVLGNHEVMNLLGDLRYVSSQDFASYAGAGSTGDRAPTAAAPGTPPLPAGYAERRAAFARDGRYGQWLLSQPVAIRINDTLFMHAGPGDGLRGLSLQDLNRRYRSALGDYVELAERLERAGLLQPTDDLDARPRLARERLAAARGATPDAAASEAVQRFERVANDALLADAGPNWYRGTALCREVTEADVLLPLLEQFGAARLVIGHTPTRDSRIVTRFDGRVVKLDTGMNHEYFRGRPSALFIEPAGLSARYAGQTTPAPLEPERLFVAPDELADDRVVELLRDGEVSVAGARGPNELQVTVSRGATRMPAVFQVRATGAAARNEMAAFRLDRALQLGLVPATVERDVQGMHGVLQARPLRSVTQADVQRQSLRVGGWCSTEPQFQLMYAFDTLIGNETRTPDSIVFDANAWYVYSTAHERGFGTSKGLPAYLRRQPPTPGPELRRRLGALDEARLVAVLGELVDARARAAILARRDALLALPAARAAGASPR